MHHKNPHAHGKITSLQDYKVCENFPNAPMVTPPQTTPNNIEPIDARNIKS